MKTLKATPQLLYRVDTSKKPEVPPGKVRIFTVQYRSFEINEKDFVGMTFMIHNVNAPEPREIAKLVRGD